jgi:hypothetical protein
MTDGARNRALQRWIGTGVALAIAWKLVQISRHLLDQWPRDGGCPSVDERYEEVVSAVLGHRAARQ